MLLLSRVQSIYAAVLLGLDEMESMENLHLEYTKIKAAADNFSLANKIGQGGFGIVYMVCL